MRIRPLLLAAPLFVVACSAIDDIKPRTPEVTDLMVSVTNVSPAGFELLVEFAAINPNGIDLQATSLTASVVLDGQYDMGTAEIAQEIDLPSNKEVRVSLPVPFDWKDMRIVSSLIAQKGDVPYD